MISITISADLIAIYAAVVATFSAVKVVYDILTDRRKIKLSYRTDVTIQNHPDYNANEQHFCIEVVNTGKRVVKIVNVGYYLIVFLTYKIAYYQIAILQHPTYYHSKMLI